LNLRFPSGGRAQLASIWHHNPGRENERHIEIFFENRYFHTLGGFASPIEVQGPKGAPAVLGKEEIENRYRKMIRWADPKNADFPSTLGHEMYAFLRRVMKGKSGVVTAEDGLAAHQIIEKAYRTGRMGAKA
jgi:predicted dehydrogenase